MAKIQLTEVVSSGTELHSKPSRAADFTKRLPWYLGACCVGILGCCHISIIGALSRRLHDNHLVNMINIVGGLVTSLVLGAPGIANRLFNKNEAKEPYRPWMLFAGAFQISVIYLAAAGQIHVGGFGLIFFNFGLIATSTIIDHFGLFRQPIRKVSIPKSFGIFLFVCGMLLGTVFDFMNDPESSEYINWYILCFIFAGVGLSIRWLINVLVSKTVLYPIRTPTNNFLGGLPLLLIIWGVNIAIHGEEVTGQYETPEWYECLSGVTECILSVATIFILPKIGAGAYSMIITMCMILCGLIFDHYGILGTPVRLLSYGRVGGFFLLVSGCCCIIYFTKPLSTKNHKESIEKHLEKAPDDEDLKKISSASTIDGLPSPPKSNSTLSSRLDSSTSSSNSARSACCIDSKKEHQMLPEDEGHKRLSEITTSSGIGEYKDGSEVDQQEMDDLENP